MVNTELINIDRILLGKEVENAINYSLENNRIDRNKLEYYRINLAEDSRCSFQILVDDLENSGLVFVKYRNKQYRLLYDKKENIVKVLN